MKTKKDYQFSPFSGTVAGYQAALKNNMVENWQNNNWQYFNRAYDFIVGFYF
jgi:hypothetical protein